MILSTLSAIPHCVITEHYGIVSGSTVRSRHAFKDLFADIKNVFGGEIRGYTELMNLARDEAIQRMSEHAKAMGANAVLNVRIATGAVAQGAAEVYAYGTAVRVETLEPVQHGHP